MFWCRSENERCRGRKALRFFRAVESGNHGRVSELTIILQRIDQGDPHAVNELLPLVYEELRRLTAQKLARENPGQTLRATALVHEAWLRLGGDDQPAWDWSPIP
jgi:ECF sigma factor